MARVDTARFVCCGPDRVQSSENGEPHEEHRTKKERGNRWKRASDILRTPSTCFRMGHESLSATAAVFSSGVRGVATMMRYHRMPFRGTFTTPTFGFFDDRLPPTGQAKK